MQLPFDWYIHIVPGSLFLLALLLFARSEDREKALGFIQKNAFATAPIALVLSYLIGLAANTAIVHLIRPIAVAVGALPPGISVSTQQQLLIDQYANPRLLQAYGSGYQHMVFLRSLWLSTLFLAVAGSKEIIKSAWSIRRKAVLITLFAAIVLALFYQWWDFRRIYQTVESSIIESVKPNHSDSFR